MTFLHVGTLLFQECHSLLQTAREKCIYFCVSPLLCCSVRIPFVLFHFLGSLIRYCSRVWISDFCQVKICFYFSRVCGTFLNVVGFPLKAGKVHFFIYFQDSGADVPGSLSLKVLRQNFSPPMGPSVCLKLLQMK